MNKINLLKNIIIGEIMPKPQPDEKESDFINRCIPFVIKEGTAKDEIQAAAICYNLWKQHKTKGGNMRKDGKVMKHLNAQFVTTDKGHIKNLKATSEDKHPTVLVVGNKFMNGEFVPASELEKVYKQWDGKYHNLNHGRNFDGKIMIQEIVGVYANSRFTENKVMVDIIEGEKTAEYDAWKGFIALNDKAERPTNVSMELWANEKTAKFSEIKHLVDKSDKFVTKANLTDDSDVTVLYDFEPAGGATVDIGAGGDDCSHCHIESATIFDADIKTTEGNTTAITTIEMGAAEMGESIEKIKENIKEKKEVIEMVEQEISQPKIEQEKPNEEMVALKKQIDELNKTIAELKPKPVTAIVTDNDRQEWVGLTAMKKLTKNIVRREKE